MCAIHFQRTKFDRMNLDAIQPTYFSGQWNEAALVDLALVSFGQEFIDLCAEARIRARRRALMNKAIAMRARTARLFDAAMQSSRK
jgi:hypothetical protein